MHLTPDQENFRSTVRAFIDERLPDALRQRLAQGFPPSKQEQVAWQRVLHERGWAAPHWPREYGGADLSTVERLVLQDELFRAPAPLPLGFNVTMLGPLLLAFGSERQKQFFLPRLASLDLWFCQGFSEPGAGSDLASLRTTARLEGGQYVVNGQKIWTTSAHNADWIFCLVRTEKTERKQLGISFLLIDLRTSGISIRPIVSIDGEHHLNEVFFDEVRVPAENLLGVEGKGWDYAKFLLGNERTGIANVGLSRERLEHAIQLAGQIGEGGRTLARQPWFMHEAALLDAEIRALEVSNWRMLVSAECDRPPAFASVLKLKGIDLQQRVMVLLSKVAGPAGMEKRPARGPGSEHWAAALVPRYFFSRAASIYGGASEIQKDILSKAILERA
jgi:pimeloyl-CoA dehydrogenase